jgi:DNA-binding response OmpR family regulator
MHLSNILPHPLGGAELSASLAATRALIFIVEKDADLIASIAAQLEQLGLDPALLARPDANHDDDISKFRDIALNRSTCRVTRGGHELRLGPTEFRLLDFLIRVPRRVFSRDQLLDGVWGEVHVEPRIVDVYIAKLRRGLAMEGQPNLIRTVRGNGYALDIA